jgi:DNA mismatch endonuclease, patch repair protein
MRSRFTVSYDAEAAEGGMDKVSPEVRSKTMARVGSRDTHPERFVRSLLHGLGLRFRLHDRLLPGTPDIVLRRHNTVIMVNGCFWHGHRCPRGKVPATRCEFWHQKQTKNRLRDARVIRELRTLGWRVIIIWECETRRPVALGRRLERVFELDNQNDLPRGDVKTFAPQ